MLQDLIRKDSLPTLLQRSGNPILKWGAGSIYILYYGTKKSAQICDE